MKKKYLFLLSAALVFGSISYSEAAIISIQLPGIATVSRPQPMRAIITDSYGNSYDQVVYYNPAIGGIDLDLSWVGPNASIYFPDLGVGYIWYNGYWVDESGYYFDRGRRLAINDPQWNVYWGNYWRRHWNDRYGHWHDRWGDRPDYRNWRQEDWRARRDDWQQGDWQRPWRGREGWNRQDRDWQQMDHLDWQNKVNPNWRGQSGWQESQSRSWDRRRDWSTEQPNWQTQGDRFGNVNWNRGVSQDMDRFGNVNWNRGVSQDMDRFGNVNWNRGVNQDMDRFGNVNWNRGANQDMGRFDGRHRSMGGGFSSEQPFSAGQTQERSFSAEQQQIESRRGEINREQKIDQGQFRPK